MSDVVTSMRYTRGRVEDHGLDTTITPLFAPFVIVPVLAALISLDAFFAEPEMVAGQT